MERLLTPRNVGLVAAGLAVASLTGYDIHRSIRANDAPPSDKQVAALLAHVDSARDGQARAIVEGGRPRGGGFGADAGR
eukprot:SM000206S06275  [mRNA]  locus=s206:83554:83876:+ [translate_table: standard]